MPRNSQSGPKPAAPFGAPLAGAGTFGRMLGAWALLAMLVWGVYGRALSAPFIFDDVDSVVQNKSITRLWPPVGTAEAPGPLHPSANTPVAGRPLVNISLALNYAASGLEPAGYRAVNISIHLLSALLIFAIIRRLLLLPTFERRFDRRNDALALAVAAIWSVHTLQTEAVVYISQRTELMMALFYLSVVYCALRYWTAAEGERARWVVLATLASFAGMASKEVMVTVPVAILLIDRTFVSGTLRSSLARSWPLYAGVASGWILLAALNLGGPRGVSAGFGDGLPASVWWLTQAKVLFLYLKLAVWPHPLAIHYASEYLETIRAAWVWIVASLVLGGFTATLLWKRKSAGLALSWILLILSPTLFVPINTEVVAERRMYLPLLAVIALAVVRTYIEVESLLARYRGREGWFTRRRALRTGVAVVVVTVLVSSVASVSRIGDYQDEVRLWEATAAAQPNNPVALYNAGVANLSRRHPEKAARNFEAAIARDSTYAPAYINLGVALLETARPHEAIPYYERALHLAPDDVQANFGYGIVLSQLARWPEAATAYKRALAGSPDNLNVIGKLVEALAQSQKPAEALQYGERAAEVARASGDVQMAERINVSLARLRALSAHAVGPDKH
jgi:tetratricopeptide (TPR) repeat protein